MLKSGYIIEISNKRENWEKTTFKFENDKILYKNRVISGNAWLEHENFTKNNGNFTEHINKMIKENCEFYIYKG